MPFNDANWHKVIDLIEKEIKTISAAQDKPPNWKEQESVYANIAKDFRYFKNAWRNHAMHARVSYDFTEARVIFNHINEFMNDLVKAGLSEPTVIQSM